MRYQCIDQSLKYIEGTQLSLEKIKYYQHKAHVERSMNFHRIIRKVKFFLVSITH